MIVMMMMMTIITIIVICHVLALIDLFWPLQEAFAICSH